MASFNDFLWTYILVAVLLGCAVWFTLRTRGVQFRMIGEMFRLLGGSRKSGYRDIDRARAVAGNKRKISSFQAFAVSLASSVGTGNLAGVAIAIAVGGPGAVFWMWVIALMGAATAFVEATLAQLFKQKSEGGFIGGPAYYIRRGLKNPYLAALFAVLLTVTFGLSYNSIQSNT
ncbi:MAG: sodium:alanine symporter family protein, partial [Bacteroidales bacterium]|nr:sodium:alanine symporter family protein [Bacteroidales bacterium]